MLIHPHQFLDPPNFFSRNYSTSDRSSILLHNVPRACKASQYISATLAAHIPNRSTRQCTPFARCAKAVADQHGCLFRRQFQ
jgi:hypothetical protein